MIYQYYLSRIYFALLCLSLRNIKILRKTFIEQFFLQLTVGTRQSKGQKCQQQ